MVLVAVGQRVCEGVTVGVLVGVRVGVSVCVGGKDAVGDCVHVGDGVTVEVTISPRTVKYPVTFHCVPTKICTS